MGKPAPIIPGGVQLFYGPGGVTFPSYLQVSEDHGILDGAIVKIKKEGVCINETLCDLLWTSKPISVRGDISVGDATKFYFLKLTLTLTITDTGRKCDRAIVNPPGPGSIPITITNDPIGTPEESDPVEEDPIYFP